MSFLELMELRVVKALVERHEYSLQRVRKAGRLAAETFDTPYPFATRRVFLDGRYIFVALEKGLEIDSDIIELSPSRHLQVQSLELVEQFLTGVEFNEETSLARRWWPLGEDVPVVLDPDVAFGAPTIARTRIRTSVVYSLSRVEPITAITHAYNITSKQVEAAVEFEKQLAA